MFSRDADLWLRFCSWGLVEILKIKFDQDLCKNHSTLGSVVPLAMFQYQVGSDIGEKKWGSRSGSGWIGVLKFVGSPEILGNAQYLGWYLIFWLPVTREFSKHNWLALYQVGFGYPLGRECGKICAFTIESCRVDCRWWHYLSWVLLELVDLVE